MLRRLWEQARDAIEAGAGPDRRPELRNLADTAASLEALIHRRWLHRPDRLAIEDAEHKLLTQRLHLNSLTQQRARRADQLERSQCRIHDAERAVDRIPEVDAAIHRRSQWLRDHPAELEWEADLTTRLAGHTRAPEQSSDSPAAQHDDDPAGRPGA